MDVTARIAEVATPGAEAAGLVVDSVEVSTRGKRTTVVVTVDLPAEQIGSADLDDVAAASRAISAALDEAEVPDGAYTLEVSTPGTDRPLTEPRHFMRARTRLVELTLVAGGTVTGRLTAADEAGVSLEVDEKQRQFDYAAIEAGRVQVEMRKRS